MSTSRHPMNAFSELRTRKTLELLQVLHLGLFSTSSLGRSIMPSCCHSALGHAYTFRSLPLQLSFERKGLHSLLWPLLMFRYNTRSLIAQEERLTLIGDKAPSTARDRSEVTCT